MGALVIRTPHTVRTQKTHEPCPAGAGKLILTAFMGNQRPPATWTRTTPSAIPYPTIFPQNSPVPRSRTWAW